MALSKEQLLEVRKKLVRLATEFAGGSFIDQVSVRNIAIDTLALALADFATDITATVQPFINTAVNAVNRALADAESANTTLQDKALQTINSQLAEAAKERNIIVEQAALAIEDLTDESSDNLTSITDAAFQSINELLDTAIEVAESKSAQAAMLTERILAEVGGALEIIQRQVATTAITSSDAAEKSIQELGDTASNIVLQFSKGASVTLDSLLTSMRVFINSQTGQARSIASVIETESNETQDILTDISKSQALIAESSGGDGIITLIKTFAELFQSALR